MIYTLIVVLWLSPGYQVTTESGLTLEQCEDAAYESKGRSRCLMI